MRAQVPWCTTKHGTVGRNPQWDDGKVQHAIIQDTLDSVACQQAQRVKTQRGIANNGTASQMTS